MHTRRAVKNQRHAWLVLVATAAAAMTSKQASIWHLAKYARFTRAQWQLSQSDAKRFQLPVVEFSTEIGIVAFYQHSQWKNKIKRYKRLKITKIGLLIAKFASSAALRIRLCFALYCIVKSEGTSCTDARSRGGGVPPVPGSLRQLLLLTAVQVNSRHRPIQVIYNHDAYRYVIGRRGVRRPRRVSVAAYGALINNSNASLRIKHKDFCSLVIYCWEQKSWIA